MYCMTCGRIKCFFQTKGYGFIEDFDGKEVYFHLTAVEGATAYDIVDGATVYFEVLNTGMGLEASRVTVSRAMTA
jgi:CspA family cold shock protein